MHTCVQNKNKQKLWGGEDTDISPPFRILGGPVLLSPTPGVDASGVHCGRPAGRPVGSID